MKTVTVSASKKYDILIGQGILGSAGALAAERMPLCRAAVISDDTVSALFGDEVCSSFSRAGFAVSRFSFSPGERSKTFPTAEKIFNFLLESRIQRNGLIVALGGGVVTDIAGFCASSYLRGVRLIHIPTTIMAAADSSVGGKCGINLSAGKNLVGAFYQPDLVICDTDVFAHLPAHIFYDGMAEVIKLGSARDKGLFEALENSVVTPSSDELPKIIKKAVEIKASIVEKDEFDRSGDRVILNFGHTIGHAVEKCSDYSIPHGHAVAIGMASVARAAKRHGLDKNFDVGRLLSVLFEYSLPASCPFERDELITPILSDKKAELQHISFVIPLTIGSCRKHDVLISDLPAFIDAALDEKGVF